MKSFFQIRATLTIVTIGPLTIILLSAQKGDL